VLLAATQRCRPLAEALASTQNKSVPATKSRNQDAVRALQRNEFRAPFRSAGLQPASSVGPEARKRNASQAPFSAGVAAE